MTSSSLGNRGRFLRVDQVGSLLRPSTLKSAFVSYLRKMTGEQELHRVQDVCIKELIATQEAHQLPVLTDGEFRVNSRSLSASRDSL